MCVPPHIMINVFNAIIIPHFDYYSLVWENCRNYLLEKLQKMQNGAASVITRTSYDVRSCFILNELGWQPLNVRRKHNKALLMHKVGNKELLKCKTNMFNIRNNTISSLRRNMEYTLEKPGTNMMKKSCSCTASKPWNDLPTSFKLKKILQSVNLRLHSGTLLQTLPNKNS